MTLRELVEIIRFDLDEKSLQNAMSKVDSFAKKASMLLTLPISALAILSLKTASNFEQMQISFETMLGDSDKAKNLINDMVKLAVTTPFQLTDIMLQTKKLMAYGIPVDKVLNDIRMLGDVAAGTSAPLEQIALAYGQIYTKGRLMGQEVLQLTNAGVPILDYLSKLTGIAKKDLPKAIEMGKISFDMVNEAFVKMTSKGGLFFDLMKKQSQSLGGLWSNLIDSTAIILNELGKMIASALRIKEVLKFLTDGTTKLTNWLKSLTPFMRNIIVITAALLALIAPLSFALLGFMALVKSLLILTKGITIFATLKSAIGLLLYPQFLLIAASIIAAAAALVLFIEDIDVWIAGGDSLTGRLLGPWERYHDGLKLLWKGISGDMDALSKATDKMVIEMTRIINHFFDDTRVGKFIKIYSGLQGLQDIAGGIGTAIGAGQTMAGLPVDLWIPYLKNLTGNKSSQNITVDSTINMQVPTGTPQQQIKAVEEAAKVAVRKELHRELNQVMRFGYGVSE